MGHCCTKMHIAGRAWVAVGNLEKWTSGLGTKFHSVLRPQLAQVKCGYIQESLVSGFINGGEYLSEPMTMKLLGCSYANLTPGFGGEELDSHQAISRDDKSRTGF